MDERWEKFIQSAIAAILFGLLKSVIISNMWASTDNMGVMGGMPSPF
jgi:hypothetical protein